MEKIETSQESYAEVSDGEGECRKLLNFMQMRLKYRGCIYRLFLLLFFLYGIHLSMSCENGVEWGIFGI